MNFKLFYLILLTCTQLSLKLTFAQDRSYYQRLNKLKKELSNKSSQILLTEYFSLFPSSFDQFVKVFGYFPKSKIKNLYENSDEHISFLESIAKRRPRKVIKRMLEIAINGSWDADAVGNLQHSLASLIGDYIEIFISEFSKIPEKQRVTIIKFLADVENHYYYKEYDEILKKLKKQKKQTYYRQFLEAKKKRMSKNKH